MVEQQATNRLRQMPVGAEPLSSLQMVQDNLADMALEIDAAALLIYRAAWAKDRAASRIAREAAMAKL